MKMEFATHATNQHRIDQVNSVKSQEALKNLLLRLRIQKEGSMIV